MDWLEQRAMGYMPDNTEDDTFGDDPFDEGDYEEPDRCEADVPGGVCLMRLPCEMHDRDIPLDDEEPDTACPQGCLGATITSEGTTPGFTGAPIYWANYSCGHQDIDDDADCLEYTR